MRAVVLDGIVLGLAYGLLGVGMTLVYGLGGVINLAYGQIVVLGAIVSSLVIEDDVSTLLAAFVGILAAAGVSVLLDLTLLAPGSRSNTGGESPIPRGQVAFQINMDGQQTTNSVAGSGFGQAPFTNVLGY